MAITLKSLLMAAPIPEEVKKQAMDQIDTLTPEQKLELSNIAWFGLSQTYNNELQYQLDTMLAEVREGKRTFNPNDFNEVKAKLQQELAQKLNAAETQEDIEEVRTQLEKITKEK